MFTLESILDIKDLTVGFHTKDGFVAAVSDIMLQIGKGETVCLVGESGSGKSVTAKTIMRLVEQENGRIASGQILVDGEDVASMNRRKLNQFRGRKVAMIFQEPLAAFDPVFTIGYQLIETIMAHAKVSKKAAWEKSVSLLERTGISEAELRMKQYPGELSGGMLQRAMIAMALACEPDLLIADEPTTALDVTIQAQIISLLHELKTELNMAILLVTHDLGVAAQLADRVVVMYAGKIVEEGPGAQLFEHPYHPYTKGLLESIPKVADSGNTELFSIKGSIPNLSEMPQGCRFHPRCPFATETCKSSNPPLESINGRRSACWYAEDFARQADWRFSAQPQESHPEEVKEQAQRAPLLEIHNAAKYYPLKRSGKTIRAVDDVSFTIYEGETFGLVGESGSGKSTLGRVMLQLETLSAGDVLFQGQSLSNMKRAELRKMRKDMQMIFQDPYGSLDPRWTIGQSIAEPLKIHEPDLTQNQLKAKTNELLQLAGLNPDWHARLPHQLSGGQRQRAGIARAIAVNPKFILADEAVSALDVSVQAQILNLLKSLQQSLGLTLLFIGHDLNVVRYVSDRIGVMYLGEMVELAPSSTLFNSPAHPYTKGLIHSIPSLERADRSQGIVIKGEIPSPADPPTGCRFHPRCPFATELCKAKKPAFQEVEAGHYASCHYAAEILEKKTAPALQLS